MVVRISKGTFAPDKLAAAERLLTASEAALAQPLRALPGLLHYYVGIDRGSGLVTNVSVWDSLPNARQMDTLQPMLAQRPLLEAARVQFEAITNHELLRSIAP
jgi:hypothetical protein